jgi:phosphoglycerate dehydrogenase-like enzyme
MSTAGIIGLGAIGGGVAICRARTGHLKAVHDMRDEQLVEISAHDAVLCRRRRP